MCHIESKSPPRRRALRVEDWPKSGHCLWPQGEVGSAEFRFCGAVSARGRPYCAEHLRRAYGATVKPKPEE